MNYSYDKTIILVERPFFNSENMAQCWGGDGRFFVSAYRYNVTTFTVFAVDLNRGIIHHKKMKPESVSSFLEWLGVDKDSFQWWTDATAWEDPYKEEKPPPPFVPTIKEKYVYFVLDEEKNKVKIGKSQVPDARLGDLQRGSTSILKLLGYIPGGHAKEAELHNKFGHLRSHGEWFDIDADLKAYIDTVLA